MYDYIELFCNLVENGNDMSYVDWFEFQEAAAISIYENANLENIEQGDIQ